MKKVFYFAVIFLMLILGVFLSSQLFRKKDTELVKTSNGPGTASTSSSLGSAAPMISRENSAARTSVTQNAKSDEPADATFYKKAHPLFHRFFELNGPVLLRDQDQDERERLLMDKVLREKAFDLIFNVEERRFDLDSEIQRLYAVDYLDEALRWKDNPTREEIILSLADKLELEEGLAPPDRRLYASIMMDRVELLMSLLHFKPELFNRFSNLKSKMGKQAFATALNQWREMAVLDIESRANQAIRKKLSKNGLDRVDQASKGVW